MKKGTMGLAVATLLFLMPSTASAARTDMVDVSNHNGYMTVGNFTAMRDRYGVKAVVTKISEGTYYHDYTARNNIQTAKQAGLYINGYHFARYNDVPSAQAEARYAVAMARQDGLPTGAVLVADVESNSNNTDYWTMTQANNAFKQIVEQAGYRYDLYTMGSWVNRRFNVNNGTGWIAQYPYNLTQARWTNHHAWQFRSDQTFYGSYGQFDASQLYDNYYTAGQNKNAVISNGDTYHVKKNVTQGNKDEDYTQYGRFIVGTNLNIRTAPSLSGAIVGKYHPGNVFTYNHVYIREGYAWARYTSYSGKTVYAALGKMGGEEYGKRIKGTATQRTYSVRYGDTLGAIAKRYGTTVSAIAQRNGIRNVNLIFPGQKLSL